MPQQHQQQVRFDRPIDLIEYGMFRHLKMLLNEDIRKVLPMSISLEMIERLREAGVLRDDTRKVSFTNPSPAIGMTSGGEESDKSLVFDSFQAGNDDIKGFHFIVCDRESLTVTLEDGIIVAAQGEAQLYTVDLDMARQVVSHYSQPEFSDPFDRILREASIARGRQSANTES